MATKPKTLPANPSPRLSKALAAALPDLGQSHARTHRVLVALSHEERDLISEAGKLKKYALATAVREFAVLCARKLLEEDTQAAPRETRAR